MDDLFLDFSLPDDLIATVPSQDRGDDRLLVCDGASLSDDHFSQFPSYLREGDLLVFNNSRVFRAALDLFTEDQSYISEILLIQQQSDHMWIVMLKKSRRFPLGTRFFLENGQSLEIFDVVEGGYRLVKFSKPFSPLDANIIGRVPIPPYIVRERRKREQVVADDIDFERYQTVFAKFNGSVAAPTASLRFSSAMMESLCNKGISLAELTLHIGPGTFKLMDDDPNDFVIHKEFVKISKELVNQIQQTKSRGSRVIAVGTTVCRALESCEGKVFEGWADIFIKPGYEFKIVDALLTNFHLPRSTLLLLVQAFIGISNTKNIYKHALKKKYRFYSYGDGMFLYNK